MHAADLGLPIAVTAIGHVDGEPTIVLPGGPCRGPEYLTDLAGLGDSYPLVVMHPRGTPSNGSLSRGWWSDAEDVVALADALDLDTVDLLAHSSGTRLALATATRFPERIRSMVLVTPPASWLTGTPYDGASIAAGRTEAVVAEAIVSMTNDDPTTEEAFRESFRRQAPAATHTGQKSSKHTRKSARSAWPRHPPGSLIFQTMPPSASEPQSSRRYS